MTRPEPASVCANCYRVWLATKPRPPAVWCWHSSHVARPTETGWSVESVKGAESLEKLRMEGIR